jgi:hypothetical protein
MSGLDHGMLAAVAARLSLGGQFWYTRRQLFYELVRKGALADPAQDPDAALAEFSRSLAACEAAGGELPKLIRPERLVDLPPPPELPPDVLDYSVRRVLVFESIDTCLFFVCNGFHRRIEVGLVAWAPPGPDGTGAQFPAHVWERLRTQLDDAALSTDFFLIADSDVNARRWRAQVHADLGGRPHVRIRDAGLTFPWAFRLRIPVRSTGHAPEPELVIPERHEWRGLLMVGSYAHLEELRPLKLMRWVYRRVARGAEDVGFG